MGATISELRASQDVVSLLSKVTELIEDAIRNNSLYPSDLMQCSELIEDVPSGVHMYKLTVDVANLAHVCSSVDSDKARL